MASEHHSIKSVIEEPKINETSGQHSPIAEEFYDIGNRLTAAKKSESTKSINVEVINRLSLGHDALHGDLYDGQRDSFIELNMFVDNKSKIPRKAIRVKEKEDYRTIIIDKNNFKDIIKFMKLDDEQTVDYDFEKLKFYLFLGKHTGLFE